MTGDQSNVRRGYFYDDLHAFDVGIIAGTLKREFDIQPITDPAGNYLPTIRLRFRRGGRSYAVSIAVEEGSE
jgi:hypothetical protein